MNKIYFLIVLLIFNQTAHSDQPKKVLCELEGNYSITYEDFRRNYFNEAVEIAKNVAVTTTQSIFFLNRAKQTLNKDAWDKNKIDVTQYWAISDSSDDLLKLDYVIEPAPVWITQSDWRKEKKETGLVVTHFLENGAIHPSYPDYKVDVYDPLIDKDDFKKEFNINLVKTLSKSYDVIVLAVAHKEFSLLNINSLKRNDSSIIFDLKGFLPRSLVTARL